MLLAITCTKCIDVLYQFKVLKVASPLFLVCFCNILPSLSILGIDASSVLANEENNENDDEDADDDVGDVSKVIEDIREHGI